MSGYIRTGNEPGGANKPDAAGGGAEEGLIGSDASHAWLSVYTGGEAGWLDVDPTNEKVAGEEHLTLAWGRDYGDVSPLKGVLVGGGSHSIDVQVAVRPVAAAPAASG